MCVCNVYVCVTVFETMQRSNICCSCKMNCEETPAVVARPRTPYLGLLLRIHTLHYFRGPLAAYVCSLINLISSGPETKTVHNSA